MPLDFYTMDASPPCRAVWMTMKALNLEANFIQVNLQKEEHLKPEYLKINPMHQVPYLDDNGFGIRESRTMMRYLVSKYGKSDELYPKELQKRTRVDQLLDFDLTLYPKMVPWLYPQLFEGKEADPEQLPNFHKALDDFNNIILPQGGRFLTGDQYTIADLSIVASLTFVEVVKFDYNRWANITRWMNNCKQLPFYKECDVGIQDWIQKFEKHKIIPKE